MSDEKWVTLTPEQVEALDQGVIVRAHRGDTMVQGPLDNVSAGGTCVGIGLSAWSRIYAGGSFEVRERDVPGAPEPRCGADHPTVSSAVPCLLRPFHDGEHFSSTGCAGSVLRWVDEPDPQRLVSVRADDLTVALDAVESCVQADDVAARIRAALRGGEGK